MHGHADVRVSTTGAVHDHSALASGVGDGWTPGVDGDAAVTVIHLDASLQTLHARLRQRESALDPTWYLDVATYLSRSMRPHELADHVVNNDDRPVRDVAAEILRRAGWLST